jgi:hypothetical protein
MVRIFIAFWTAKREVDGAICGFHRNDSHGKWSDKFYGVRISFMNTAHRCSHYYSIYVNRLRYDTDVEYQHVIFIYRTLYVVPEENPSSVVICCVQPIFFFFFFVTVTITVIKHMIWCNFRYSKCMSFNRIRLYNSNLFIPDRKWLSKCNASVLLVIFKHFSLNISTSMSTEYI